jgi:CBS domain-containing protein
MEQLSVRDVMTPDPVAVGQETTYQDVIRLLDRRSVSAVPVVDSFDRVLGVVSATDLAHRLELADEPHQPAIWTASQRRVQRRKATANLAGELMSWPAVTVSPGTSVTDAARLMKVTEVGRLPVVDDLGRLIGMVTRRDLVQALVPREVEAVR